MRIICIATKIVTTISATISAPILHHEHKYLRLISRCESIASKIDNCFLRAIQSTLILGISLGISIPVTRLVFRTVMGRRTAELDARDLKLYEQLAEGSVSLPHLFSI